MQEVSAFKCEYTGRLFSVPKDAVSSEFKSLMKAIGGSLPHMGSVNSTAIMEWLASNIESGIYPDVFKKLKAAVDYYDKNQSTITPAR